MNGKIDTPLTKAYWGKTARGENGWHPLIFHCLDVAAAATALLDLRPRMRAQLEALSGLTTAELRAWVVFWAALHDLGKWSSAFQGQDTTLAAELGQEPGHPDYTIRHDSLGWALWQQRLGRRVEPSKERRRRLDVWARLATGHHGQPPTLSHRSGLVRLTPHFRAGDLLAAEGWLDWCIAFFDPPLGIGDIAAFERASWWLAGLITLADWAGSSLFQQGDTGESPDAYWSRVSAEAPQAIRDAGLSETTESRKSFSTLFPSYVPTPVQQAADGLPEGPGLTVIEDLTGSGKTEAALAAAGPAFFFALPTMATANGLWARVSTHSGLDAQKALVHGGRWHVPDAMRHASAWLVESNKTAMLAPIGVGTVDQPLLAVLHARFAALRLVGLAGRTLIVDEVHAYDDYQRALLETLIERQAQVGNSVILLSATMPLCHRHAYAEAWARGRGIDTPALVCTGYPLVTHLNDQQLLEQPQPAAGDRSVAVQFTDNVEVVLDAIVEQARDGRCVCWIRNTVVSAIQASQVLSARGLDPLLFHARFTVGDRQSIEQQVLTLFGKTSTDAERHGRVLIATQVVEQSLDLDFDFMVSDLAPIDLIIQRAGRIHRHDRGERGAPALLVHAPAWTAEPDHDWVSAWDSGTAYVYKDPGRLWVTQRELSQRGGLTLPSSARALIESVYGPTAMDDLPAALHEVSERQTEQAQSNANQALWNAVSPRSAYEADGSTQWDEADAFTRLGERSEAWVLICEGRPISGTDAESLIRLRESQLAMSGEPNAGRRGTYRALHMVRNGNAYEASGVDRNGRPVQLTYQKRVGMVMNRT